MQPSEIAKIWPDVYLSASISKNKDRIKNLLLDLVTIWLLQELCLYLFHAA